MRFFFRSRQFKIILSVFLCLVAISVIFTVIGGKISPQADILGTITAPFRAAATFISESFTDISDALSGNNETELRNVELENEVNELREKLADYEAVTAENEFYKNYLEIKENNPDFKMLKANLISKDVSDPYKGFVINQGTVQGVNKYDPVITDAGLVGFVSQAGLTTSKVTTILSPDITLGAMDNRTEDSGVLSGSMETAEKSYTKFFNLSRSCNIAVGDYVVTSGEGVFPDGLLIGTIRSIGSDEYNTSIFAEVEPFVSLDEIRGVMVITDFEGQGGIQVGSGE